MVLTDTDIRSLLCDQREWADKQNKLHIFPFLEDRLTPVGYDLRVGDRFATTEQPEQRILKGNDELVVTPGSVVLIETLETIGMPKNKLYCGLIESKVSLVAQGLSDVSTTVDPDWQGRMLVALHNPTDSPVTLRREQPFCTLVLFKNLSPATKDCGKPEGRSDILLTNWERKFKKVKKIRIRSQWIAYVVPVAVVAMFTFCGWFFFTDNTGFPALVGSGATIATFLSAWLRDRIRRAVPKAGPESFEHIE